MYFSTSCSLTDFPETRPAATFSIAASDCFDTYRDAIDSAKLVAASADRKVKVSRWRINDNLPGTRHFCPTIVKTDGVTTAMALDVPQLFQNLTDEFGEDLLQRAAVWMTLGESKASSATVML